MLQHPLVALDVDGTVLHHDGSLSPRVHDAIRAVVASGRHVVIATGRSLVGTVPVLEQLGLATGYAVTSNGAVTVRLDPSLPRGHEVVEMVTFDPSPALRLLREHLPQAVYAVEDLGLGYRLTGPFPDDELLGDLTIVPFEQLLHERATRVVVRSPEHTPEDFLELVTRLGLHGGSYAVGWTAWLDIAPEGVTKAHGLALVADVLGLQASDVLAVGDGRNDLDMFAWAGRSVAMGQASPDVLAGAGESCPGVDDDGLAILLESVLAAQEATR